MSPRFARLVFGSLPPGDAGLADVIDGNPATVSRAETPILTHLRQKFRSDEALVEQIQEGDSNALTVLFDRYGARLFAIARRILRNDAEAEDAVQQTFLDVFRSIQQFDPDKGKFRAWLFMFGYQRIFNCRRSLSANRFFETDPFDEFAPGLAYEPERRPCFSQAETAVLIEQVLSGLQFRQRRTIELVYYEGLTAEEISIRTGETVRVVRHNLYRGLEKLRKAVGGETRSPGNLSKGAKR
jgi:RNA polymerase sigma-70 factor (ECF subfamily)